MCWSTVIMTDPMRTRKNHSFINLNEHCSKPLLVDYCMGHTIGDDHMIHWCGNVLFLTDATNHLEKMANFGLVVCKGNHPNGDIQIIVKNNGALKCPFKVFPSLKV